MSKEELRQLFPDSRIEEEIIGCDGLIIPILLSGKRVFFKLLPKEKRNAVEREVQVVEKVKETYSKIPDYYKNKNQIIFESDDEIFYGTVEVNGLPSTSCITKELLQKMMVELARLHKSLKQIPVTEKKESDRDRLIKFYQDNKPFFEEHQFTPYIEMILGRDYEEEEYSYIHGDVNFRNILVEKNEITSFIDFTDLRVGYLEDDLGKLLSNILYLDLEEKEIEELISIYEKELGNKVNQNNLYLSIVYRLLYRYFGYIKNQEGKVEEYRGETEKILQKISRRVL